MTSGLIHGAKRDRRVTVIVVVGIALATLVFGASLAWISRPKTPSERDERWGNVLLYVDNATNRPCEVVIDGDVRATLRANTFGSLKLRSGKRRIHLRQDADVVEEDRELAANHKYLVALGRSNTYAEYRAEYRSNIFPQIPVFIISESQLQNILREAAEKLPRSVSLDAWNDVSLYDDVLYQPPKEIEIRSTNSGGASGERRVLTRLSQSDLEFLRTARADAAIGRGNMDDLRRFMERVSGHK